MFSAIAKDGPKVDNENSVRWEKVALIVVRIFALVRYTYAADCISAQCQSHEESPTYRTQRLPTISFFPDCFKVAQIHMVLECRQPVLPHHPVHFFMQLFLHLGVQQHTVKEIGHCSCDLNDD